MNITEIKQYLSRYKEYVAQATRLREEGGRFTASQTDINREINEYLDASHKIETLIHSHRNCLEREVLLCRYIYGDTNEEIAEALGYSVRHIQRIIDRATEKIGGSL